MIHERGSIVDWAERRRTLRRMSTQLTAIATSGRKISIELSSPGAISAPPHENEIQVGSRRVSLMVKKVVSETGWRRFVSQLQVVYEKSKIKHLLPILLLMAYSFLGGFIFYSIEKPNEDAVLVNKRSYISHQRRILDELVWNIKLQVFDNERRFRNHEINEVLRNRRWRELRKMAEKDFRQAVYWYTLIIYYLSDPKTKTGALRPKHMEARFKDSYKKDVLGPVRVLQNYTEQLAERFWEIAIDSEEIKPNVNVTQAKINEALELFRNFTGISDVPKSMWTFWNSMFLAVTTYTTIGYGNIVPKTRSGQTVAIFYAIFGIPMVLMILHKLGHLFLYLLQRFWDFILWLFQSCQCIAQPDKLKGRSIIVETGQGGETSYSIPVTLAVGVTFGWMFACASIFLYFETEWDYFTSFYFFFISLTTIGFGDVVPTKSEDVFIIFALIIIGLSLVSMCINVVQIKIEHLLEDLMLAMMEEYQNAQLTDGGAMVPPPDMKAGFMQLWRMWNKRKSQSKAGAAESARRESNLALLKSVPKNRRKQHLLEEWKRRSKMRDKVTQTDPLWFMSEISAQTEFFDNNGSANGKGNEMEIQYQTTNTQTSMSAPYENTELHSNDIQASGTGRSGRHLSFGNVEVLHNGQYGSTCSKSQAPLLPLVPEDDWEEMETPNDSLMSDSYGNEQTPTFTDVPPLVDPLLLHEKERLLLGQGPSIATLGRSLDTLADLGTTYAKFIANAGYRRPSVLSPNRRQSDASAQSAPVSTTSQSSQSGNNNRAEQSSNTLQVATRNSSSTPINFDPMKRWKFVETGATPRGAPRGLVHAMWMRKESQKVENDDLKRLMREMEARLSDCRSTIETTNDSINSLNRRKSPI